VVIYYVRLRDLNSHEEWTFKTRYSELRNVHEALSESMIKNLYILCYSVQRSQRRRFSESLTKVLRILRNVGRNYKNISMNCLIPNRFLIARLFDTLSSNRRRRHRKIRNYRRCARRRVRKVLDSLCYFGFITLFKSYHRRLLSKSLLMLV
jgi:hypothetical protein